MIVYDPQSALRRSGLEEPFATGVTVLGSVTVPVKPFGLTGFQGIKAITTTAKGFELANLQQLFLPSGSQAALGRKGNAWFTSYSFQQYLVQDPSDPRIGWGVFGEIAVEDGNPTPLDWSVYVGIGGTSFIPDRAQDRFGIGFFRYSPSNVLVNSLRPIVGLRDEQGIEAFYNIAVTDKVNVTPDIQMTNPILAGKDTAVFAGLRTQIQF